MSITLLTITLLVFIGAIVVVSASNEWVAIPNGGMIHTQCIHRVGNDKRVEWLEEGGARVHHTDGSVSSIPPCPSHLIWENRVNDYNPVFVAEAVQQTNGTYYRMSANTTVPEAPAKSSDQSLVMYWSGLEDTAKSYFMSPVLWWGNVPGEAGGGQYWTLAVWGLKRARGTAVTGDPIPNLEPGTAINNMAYGVDHTMGSVGTVLSTKKNSNLYSYCSWDIKVQIAHFSAALRDIDDKSCDRLPATGYQTWKDITILDPDHTPVSLALKPSYPGANICNHQVIPKDNSVVMTYSTK